MMRAKTAPFNGISGALRWGKLLFLACGLDGLKVFELNGDKAKLIAHLKDFPAFDLAFRDGFIAVAAGKRGVVLLDVKNLSPMQILPTDFPVHGISWNQDKLIAHTVSIGNNHSLTL